MPPSTGADVSTAGAIPPDQAAIAALAGLPQLVVSDAAHAAEHSLEVQLPFLQTVLGFSAIHAGLSLIPTSIGIMVVGPIAGRLADRINGKYILLAGLLGAAAGIVLTAWTLSLSITSWQLVLPLAR